MEGTIVICVIASQGTGSNHKEFKREARPMYLRGTIRSLLENTRPPDYIFVSYNDCTEEGSRRYTETVEAFADVSDRVIFLKQETPQTQFQHINHAIRAIAQKPQEPHTQILFMDDDDLLGREVISMFTKWYETYDAPTVRPDAVAELALSEYKDQKPDSTILSEPHADAITPLSISKPYMWFTDRLRFGSLDNVPEMHISEIKKFWGIAQPDFPGTIMPLSIATVTLNHMNWNEHSAADVLFSLMTQQFLTNSNLGIVIDSHELEDDESCRTDQRLLYREI